jgi:hypothetical protein
MTADDALDYLESYLDSLSVNQILTYDLARFGNPNDVLQMIVKLIMENVPVSLALWMLAPPNENDVIQ